MSSENTSSGIPRFLAHQARDDARTAGCRGERIVAAARVLEIVGDRRCHAFERGVEHRVLARIVPVEGGRRDADPGRDRGDAHRAHPRSVAIASTALAIWSRRAGPDCRRARTFDLRSE
jgi:hypothetical protein